MLEFNEKIKMKLDEDNCIQEEIKDKLAEMGSLFKLADYLRTVGVDNPKLCKNCYGRGLIGYLNKRPLLCLCVIRQIRSRKVAYVENLPELEDIKDEERSEDETNQT